MNHGGNKKLPILLALFFLLGAGLSIENKFHFMRLKGFSLSPSNYNIESFLWKSRLFPSQRVWVSWVWNFSSLKREVEEEFPIRLTWSLRGWGRIETRYVAIKPHFLLLWRQKVWCVSDDGLLWEKDFSDFHDLVQLPESLPCIEWSDELMAPFEVVESRKVHPVLLPMEKIFGWLDGLRQTGWLEKATCVIVERQGGRFRLRLTMNLADCKDVTLLVPDAPRSWQAIAEALGPIIKDCGKRASVMIDGTYGNKIVVK